jgi:pyruvate dehydrogenase E1 component beta subunit
MRAARILLEEGIAAEVIDLRSVKPFDIDLIISSVRQSGRLVVVDGGWKTCGFGAEVSALVDERAFEYLKAPILRVTLPDCPAPASSSLEKEYYAMENRIVLAAKELVAERWIRRVRVGV